MSHGAPLQNKRPRAIAGGVQFETSDCFGHDQQTIEPGSIEFSGEEKAETRAIVCAGHKVEAAKMDCALTPSDACVLSGSEDGASQLLYASGLSS